MIFPNHTVQNIEHFPWITGHRLLVQTTVCISLQERCETGPSESSTWLWQHREISGMWLIVRDGLSIWRIVSVKQPKHFLKKELSEWVFMTTMYRQIINGLKMKLRMCRLENKETIGSQPMVISSLNGDVGKFCLHLFHKQWVELVWDRVTLMVHNCKYQLVNKNHPVIVQRNQAPESSRDLSGCKDCPDSCLQKGRTCHEGQPEWVNERRTLLLKQGWTSAQ